MRYWYFLFEGRLKQEAEYGKFFSSVIVPVKDSQTPTMALIQALLEYDAELINIEDSFEFVEDEYDLEDSDNRVWFDWIARVKSDNSAIFTPWQKFK